MPLRQYKSTPFYLDEKASTSTDSLDSTDSLLSSHSTSDLPLAWSRRTRRIVRRYRMLASLALLAIAMVFAWLLLAPTMRARRACTPAVIERGRWQLKDDPPYLFETGQEVLTAIGSPGAQCSFVDEASAGFAITEIGWPRITSMMSYEWKSECRVPSKTPVQQVQWMLDNGGWLFVGDSLSRQHFALLSCQLGELLYHGPSNESDEHEATHDLFVNTTARSSYTLRLPSGFNASSTPLVTFKRADLLYSRQELLDVLHKRLPQREVVFPTEHEPGKLYAMPSNAYLDLLRDNERRYSTVIASTGAHWTRRTLNATTHDDVLDYFDASMRQWVDLMKHRLAPTQQLLARAATPGHSRHTRHLVPSSTEPYIGREHNWRIVPELNKRFKAIVEGKRMRRISWIGGERPARLRGDAHNSPTDGLHFNLGGGPFATWNTMIWSQLGRW